MRPRIVQTDDRPGFYWATEEGVPISLPELVLLDDEPERLVPTHLEALDDALIDAAGRFGELLGGGRAAGDDGERRGLHELHRVLDRLNYEYAAGARVAELPIAIRGGQIIGTSALIAIRARMALGIDGPAPLAGELTDPNARVVSGRGQLQQVDHTQLWRGARWVVQSEDGPRFPLTLSMLMFDSSGVNKDAALVEHREALAAVTLASRDGDADPFVVAGALDWLLYDWLMAHRESSESGAIEIRNDRGADAEMIVWAAEAGAAARARIDSRLLTV